MPTGLEVLPRPTVPVATTAHLIALKVLAGRSQDLTDLGYLIAQASPTDSIMPVRRRASAWPGLRRSSR